MVGLSRRQNQKTFDVEVKSEQTSFSLFQLKPACNEQLIKLRATKRDIAGRNITTSVLRNQFALGVQYLNLLHTLMSDIEIACLIKTHAIRLILQ